MKIKILIAAAVMTLMSGCSVVSFLEKPVAQPFDASGVAVGVDALVGQNVLTQATRAAAIKGIALEVLAVDNGTVATLATLETVAAAKVQALGLPPGDAAASQLFIATLSAAVNAYAGNLGTNAKVNEIQVDVATVLNWVIAECDKFLPKTAGGPSLPFPVALVSNRSHRGVGV